MILNGYIIRFLSKQKEEIAIRIFIDCNYEIDIPRKIFIDSLNVENGIEDSEYVKIMDTILSNLDSYV